MKQKYFSLLIIVVSLMSFFFMSGCKKEEVKQTVDVPTSHWNMIAGDDPQIVKELEYMRDQKIISPKTYSRWIKLPKNYFMVGGNSYVDENGKTKQDELYLIPPYDPLPVGIMTDPDFIDRKNIQAKMNANS